MPLIFFLRQRFHVAQTGSENALYKDNLKLLTVPSFTPKTMCRHACFMQYYGSNPELHVLGKHSTIQHLQARASELQCQLMLTL